MVESTSATAAKVLNLVVFGATGNTGIELCKQALDAGHKVTAFVRNPDKLKIEHPNLTKVKAELNDEAAMDQAIKDKDAVLCSLGGKGLLTRDTTCSVGTKAIICSMKKQGVSRLIVCSAYGAGPGNRSLLPWAIRAMLYHPMADKDVQEALIVDSGLDYTIVRPPSLVDKPPQGTWVALESGRLPHMKISRADVATFMLETLYKNSWVKMTPHLSWPSPAKAK
jgi:uncharacterized protein YbjT (DUF2867 family)